MKARTLLLVLTSVALFTALVVVFFLSKGRAIIIGKAAGEQYNLKNSYVFASPLSAKIPSGKIRITVFLLNEKGRGVKGKTINLFSNPPGLNFLEVQSNTDKMGQAVFDGTSSTPGKYEIGARIDNDSFPQTVTVMFE